MTDQPTLARSLSLPLVTFYGLGTILGAGIYVLLGAVAAEAGRFTPLAFVAAAVIAGFTAFTFAELSARLPFCGGEAIYVDAAFANRWLTRLVGFAVVVVGVVSAATMTRGFHGYLALFVNLPTPLVTVLLVGTLGVIAAVGVVESVWIAAIITAIEMAGLVLVIAVGATADAAPAVVDAAALADSETLSGIGAGAFLAFYAFIGFEDMVNLAEEVKEPERAMPRAIVLALVGSTVLYFAVAAVAIRVVPLEQLAGNNAPLAAVTTAGGIDPLVIGGISLIAVVNGALIQLMKASRVLLGLARQGLVPRFLGRVSARTRTPLVATIVTVLLALIFALALPLVTLAALTSLATLIVFALLNLALWRLKSTDRGPPPAMTVPRFVPVVGFWLCLVLVAAECAQRLGVWS